MKWVTWGLVALLLLEALAALLAAPLNLDAGYYLPLARRVALGQRPVADFPTNYPPLGYYLLAPLGPSGLRWPVAVKAAIYAVHAASAVLLYGTLARWGVARDRARFFTVLGAGWVWAADGKAVALEPLQNWFLILALWIAAPGATLWRALLIGLCGGAALMVKQYALLQLPVLCALAVVGFRTTPTAAGAPLDAARVARRFAGLTRAIVCLTAATLPFGAWNLATRQSPAQTASVLANFGGYAGRYQVAGPKALFVAVTEQGGPFIPLLPLMLVCGVWLVASRERGAAVLSAGLLAALAPLVARQYPHYVQSVVPWGILALAMAVESLARRDRLAPAANVCALALGLCWLPGMVSTAGLGVVELARHPIADQERLAAALRPELGDGVDVAVVNLEWLYALDQITPPGGQYRFVDPLAPEAVWPTPPRLVVVGPGQTERSQVAAWLATYGSYRERNVSSVPSVWLFERQATPATALPVPGHR